MQVQTIQHSLTIRQIHGADSVRVIAVDGTESLRFAGDLLSPGEQVYLADGVQLETAQPNAQGTETIDPEVAALQQLLMQGADLEELPDTAAGQVGAQGQESFIKVDRNAVETQTQGGYQTAAADPTDALSFRDSGAPLLGPDADIAPIISAGEGAVIEDTLLTADGQLSANDSDNPDLAFVADTLAGSYGSLTVDANGNWTYTLAQNATVDALTDGEQVTDVITVTLTDGSETQVTITVTGTDDAPVISEDTGSVTEDTDLVATGTLTATDSDNPDLAFVADTIAGSYGSLTVDANGNWTYTLAQNATVDALIDGEQVTDVITVTLNDGSETQVTITVTGTDDAPVISEDIGSVTEDTALTAEGQLTATDADNPDLAFVADTLSGSYGSLTVDAQGNWTYTLAQNATVDALTDGEQVTDVITVTLTDGSETQVTITVTGTDDAPVISEDSGSVTEDTDLIAEGQLTATDADNPDLAFVADTLAGSYGSLSVDANGNWTYTLAQNATVDALTDGEQVTDVITVTLTDGSETQVTITVTGTDDAPVISEDSGSVTEDTVLTAEGQLTATDADNPDLAFVADTLAGSYGSLVVDANGNWTYTLAQNATVDALTDGEQVTDVITVTLTDGSETQVTITVTGTDDAPVISEDSGSVTEDTVLTADGQLTATDADNPDLAFVADTLTGSYGSLVVDASGNWTYTLAQNATVDALTDGEQVTDVITVTLTDGSQTQVTITVTGTDDAPVISEDSGSVTEDTVLTAEGQLSATDADNPDLAFVADTLAGSYGSLTLDANGNWTYTLAQNATVDALTDGEQVTDVITVTLTDGSQTQVTITVTGTDDAPVISQDTGSVTEDTVLTAEGQLTATDADNPDLAFVADTLAGSYGSLVVDAQGNWTYTLAQNATVDALTDGEQVTDVITVTLTDGSETQVTITVTGTDDAPVISEDSGSVTEDTVLTAEGQLTATDADNPDLAFVADTLAGSYGSLVVDANGNWTYTLAQNATIDALTDGEQVTDVITVTLTDGSETQVTITVTGTDDAPVISEDSGSVTEDTVLTAEGQLTATDADNPDLAFVADTLAGSYGSLVVDANGNWTYTLAQNATVDALTDGEQVTDVITVTLTDGSQTQVTITVTGTDDAPVISEDSGSVTEDTVLTAEGQLSATDADNPDLAFVADTIAGSYGSLVVDANGNWTYTLAQNATVDALTDGEQVTDVITVTLTDGSETQVTITVTGTDDAPVISEDSGSVTEDTVLTAEGQLTATDADNPDLAFVADTLAGSYGSLVVDANGNWTYTLAQNATVDALADGEQVTDVITVTLTDGSETQVTITVTGTDDAPVISEDSGSVTEDTVLTADGQLTATDADNPDLAFVADTLAGSYGSLVVDAQGNWTYTLAQNATVDALADGEQVTDVITVTLTDGSETQVTITVTGTNDAPSISADSGSVTEDIDVNNGMLATGGDLNLVLGADDSNTTLSFEADGDDYLGTFVVNDDGSWSFSVDNSLDAIQQLGPDDSLVQTYTVTVDDGQGGVLSQTVTVTIQGTGELEGGDLAGITLDDAATEGNQTDTQTTTLTFTLGVFAIAAYAFGDTDGIQIDGLDGSLSWQVVSGSLVGYLDGDLQQPMISLSLQDLGDGNVSVQATLMENLQHQVDLDQLTISGIEVVATDAGGNSASGQVNLTVLDDGISLVAGDLQGENAANYHGEGTLELEGVDQGYSADFNPTIAKLMGDSYQGEAFTDSGLTSNGYSVFYYVDPANPDVLIAYLDTNDVPSAYQGEDGANGQQLIFTLTADPDNGSYSIDGHVSIDSLETIEIAGVEGATGGNGPILYIGYDSTTGAFDVEYNAADIAPNFELAFTLTARSNDGSEGKVNGNNNGVGIDNAFIQDDEVLIVDYQQDVAATSVSFAGADEIAYRAFDADGNLLDEGTIRSGEVIENVGSISYIELMSAGSGSEFRFQFSGTSAETIVSTTKDVTLDFTLGVTDSDGDTVEDDFTIELAAPGPDNQGDDIILGDAGGSELQEQPLDYNYVIMIDTSESLYTWELQEVKAAVTNMLNSMKDHPGTVTVKLIGFAKNVDGQSQDTFDVTDPDQLASAQAFVEALFSRGVTNYEAAFQEAIDWLQGDAPAADETHTFLITDGIPTANLRGDDANGTQSGNSERAIKHLLGQANNDSQDEVALLNSLSNSLRAVGFGMDPDQLLTDAVDLTGDGQPDNVTTQLLMDHIDSSGAAQLLEGSNGLDQTLQNLVELTLDGVGRQLLDGGAGNDILFGDSPNTDELAQQQGLDLPPGSGTKVFEALEQDPANNWSREDTLNYVRTHHQTLSQESVDSGGQGRDGGDDILYGGAGDDILYGQEGDDLLVGGLGSDLLSGGSGADTFAWRDGDADGSLDTVVDFSRADGDRLDLSDLLVGEEQGDLTDYLNVSTDGTDTTIEVTPTGVGAPSLTIVLEGNQYQDLDALLQDGALVLDSAQPSANNAAGGPAIDVAPQQNELLP